MNTNFFDSNSYFIDEKVNFLKFENEYKVYNDKGEYIGAIKQKLSTGDKVLRLFLNKGMMPFHLDIVNANGGIEASITRGWTFFMSKIVIKDAHGAPVGNIKQKFRLFKPTFTITDMAENVLGRISGDWKAWNFIITDSHERQIGVISKKWAGAMKEIFTSADKYNVMINPDYTDKHSKMIILSGAITIDMVLKESK